MRKKKQLDIATKGLREMIIKQNTREFRKEQQDKEARKSKEYGKVLYEVRSGVSWKFTKKLLQGWSKRQKRPDPQAGAQKDKREYGEKAEEQ